MNRAQAFNVAQDALIWLAGRPEEFSRFLVLTGTEISDLRASSGDPGLLGAVLDHLLSADALVLAFAQDSAFDPGLVARARAALPGGDVPHWT